MDEYRVDDDSFHIRTDEDGFNDDTSSIGTDEDGLDDFTPIETDEGPPAPPAFNPLCDLNLHASPIETDEGPPGPAFDLFCDLNLHASERPAVPSANDNPVIHYSGANAFKNKDWQKG